MIRIIYRTGEEDLVSPKFLDILLYLDQVQLFERSAGWVVVGVDQLRGSLPATYSGPDQRQHKQTSLPAPVRTDFWSQSYRAASPLNPA
ncbi:GSU3473 family protein [Geopsychrobacter electrodiphilus]|uniref:GSU3473 family protein n=1 Tax=Geopsychrobacter electrodiphilus TaxID=225196 RepID=UPI00036601B1|nr:hypothetical protein [Geopsychrobacter electrodiphilus]